MRFGFRKRSTSRKSSKLRDWVRACLWALAIIWCIKTFVFNWTIIDSTSMRQSLEPGDFVIVNKMGVGGRLPVSPLSIPFTDLYINASIPAFRFFSFSDIERNDVLVFNDPQETEVPIDRRTQLVKRCVGLPGDTVDMSEKFLFVNGESAPDPHSMTVNWYLQIDPRVDMKPLFEQLNVVEGMKLSDDGDWLINTTWKSQELLSQFSAVKDMSYWYDDQSDIQFQTFPQAGFGWTMDDFDQIVIPKEGLTVELTAYNRALYKQVIETHESHTFEIVNDEVLIDGAVATSYTFEQNYYYMLGDNRDNASDSRFWGFLPEDHIIGTAKFVLFSVEKDETKDQWLRWDRWFHGI